MREVLPPWGRVLAAVGAFASSFEAQSWSGASNTACVIMALATIAIFELWQWRLRSAKGKPIATPWEMRPRSRRWADSTTTDRR